MMRGINIGLMTPQTDFAREFARLQGYGIKFARLTAGMFVTAGRVDMKSMLRLLAEAYTHDIKIIIGLFWHGPGPENAVYSPAQLTAQWVDVIDRLAGHPGVAAWELTNEPDNSAPRPIADWLNYWQPLLIRLIRRKSDLPVIVSAEPGAFWTDARPIEGDKLIHTVHHYAPYPWVSQGLPGYPERGETYPDFKWYSHYRKRDIIWNLAGMEFHFQSLRDWQLKYGTDIFVGEFSTMPGVKGGDGWIADSIKIFEKFGWGWSYFCDFSSDWIGFEGWKASAARLAILKAAWA